MARAIQPTDMHGDSPCFAEQELTSRHAASAPPITGELAQYEQIIQSWINLYGHKPPAHVLEAARFRLALE